MTTFSDHILIWRVLGRFAYNVIWYICILFGCRWRCENSPVCWVNSIVCRLSTLHYYSRPQIIYLFPTCFVFNDKNMEFKLWIDSLHRLVLILSMLPATWTGPIKQIQTQIRWDLDTAISVYELSNRFYPLGHRNPKRKEEKTHNKLFVDSIHCHFHDAQCRFFIYFELNKRKKSSFSSANANGETKQKHRRQTKEREKTTLWNKLSWLPNFTIRYISNWRSRRCTAFFSIRHFKPLGFFCACFVLFSCSVRIFNHRRKYDDNLAGWICIG